MGRREREKETERQREKHYSAAPVTSPDQGQNP